MLRGAAVAAEGKASAPHSTFATRVASRPHTMSERLSSMFRLRRSTTASLLSVRTSSAHVRLAFGREDEVAQHGHRLPCDVTGLIVIGGGRFLGEIQSTFGSDDHLKTREGR
jgi:hypothetical protein